MPVLARFYSIIIRMYFLQSEHNPPHIHAIYNEDVAAIDFMTGEVIEGHLPASAVAKVSVAVEGNVVAKVSVAVEESAALAVLARQKLVIAAFSSISVRTTVSILAR